MSRNELEQWAVKEEEGVAPYCTHCGSGEYLHNADENRNEYCGQCGVKLNWSNIEDDYDYKSYAGKIKEEIEMIREEIRENVFT